MMHLLEESGMNDAAAGMLGKYFVFGWLYGDFILSRTRVCADDFAGCSQPGF